MFLRGGGGLLSKFYLLFASVFFLCHLSLVEANEIYSLRLDLDGSVKPPGDRIRVVVLLFPEVREAAAEVAAYIVSGNSNEEQVRVPASARSNNKDSKGDFQLHVP